MDVEGSVRRSRGGEVGGTGAGAPHIHTKWARRVSQRPEVNGDRWTDRPEEGPEAGGQVLFLVPASIFLLLLSPKSGRGCVETDPEGTHLPP